MPIELELVIEEPIELGASQTGGTVLSVNGKKGDVVLTADDVNAVEKVAGKGLSTEDYTTAEKNKLAGIESGAEVNNISDGNAQSLVEHLSDTNNPHSTTYSQVGAEPANANIQTHIGTTGNPHGTSDANLNITDITTNDVSTSKHGFFPKLPTALGKFLRDDLSWQTVITTLASAIGVSELKDELKKTITMAANEIDWAAGTHFVCESSGAVTLTETNLTSKKNFGIVLKIPNATSVSFPAGWVLKTGADTFGATSSIYALNENGTVVYTIRNNA